MQASRDDGKLYWKCSDCGAIRQKKKPGASEGSRAIIMCYDDGCKEKKLHVCIGSEKDGGVPFDN